MPTDRRAQERRREAILAILEVDSWIGQQQDLVDRLGEMGIPATQSSVSRDLKALGVVWAGGCYAFPSKAAEESLFRRLLDYVFSVKPVGHHMTLIKTYPGAGPLVAKEIEAAGWPEVAGTVAGHDSALILTETALGQKRLTARLRRYLDEGLEP